MKIFIASLTCLVMSSQALAGEFKPVVIETASAKAYVVPPITRWSQDHKLQALMDHARTASPKPIQFYGMSRARDARGQYKALRFDEKETDVAVVALFKEVQSRGMNIKTTTNLYETQEPIQLSKDALAALKAEQNSAYLAWAKSADPLKGRPMTGKEIGGRILLGGLSLGVFLLTGGVDISSTLGAEAASFGPGMTASLNLKKDGPFPPKYEVGAMPAYELELDGYEHIDYRGFMTNRERSFVVHGEIIIAYRGPKTKEAEDEILPLAWIAGAAMDLTEDQLNAARETEKAYRVAVWEACVSAGECK